MPDLESAIQSESEMIIKPFVTKPVLACVITQAYKFELFSCNRRVGDHF